MKKKTLTALAMASVCMATTLASCGGAVVTDGGDSKTKTTIRVATFDGGVGQAWLDDAADAFETLYAETRFEEGKMGVEVKVSPCEGGDMLATKSLSKDVYLTEQVDYFTQYVNKGKLADISDVVTEKLTAFGEDKSIEDKLDGAMSSYLSAKDGKYYAIPFYDGIYGFIYDVDVFEKYGWFFDEDGNFTDGKTKAKSKGMDGIAGTYDDGMPETYTQFQTLVEQIRNGNSGLSPFMYGKNVMNAYPNRALANYWADYEGKTYMDVNYSQDGTAQIIEKFNEDGTPKIKKIKITTSNYTELQKQPGKYYALKFLDEVVCGNEKNHEMVAAGYSQAQYKFLEGTTGAMLIDGIWWENEAEQANHFDDASKDDYDYDASTGETYRQYRNFAFMPIPMEDSKAAELKEGETHKQTLLSLNNSYCFISGTTKDAKLEASKLFVQFLHTDAQLSAFTVKTSITRSLNYTISEADKAKATPFGQSVIDMKNASDIVYPYSGSEFFRNNSAAFSESTWIWKAQIKTSQLTSPFEQFRNNNYSAQEYFEGLYNVHKTK